jgi:cephalosporin hydroxylase
VTIDFTDEVVTETVDGNACTYPMNSTEGFKLASSAWLRCGWDVKYAYSFSWLGRPVIQLPEDLMRVQEVIYKVKPDLIIETGIAHGGSLIFYATILKALGQGKVIGIDIEIRQKNRKAIEAHELSALIDLIEGSSVDPAVVQAVRYRLQEQQRTLVILDSAHTKAHVLAELRTYCDIVSVDSYLVATDGVMKDLVGAPRSQDDWTWNNPYEAIMEFLQENDSFVLEEPAFAFNEGLVKERVTYCE